jgi:hypothetical protein
MTKTNKLDSTNDYACKERTYVQSDRAVEGAFEKLLGGELDKILLLQELRTVKRTRGR